MRDDDTEADQEIRALLKDYPMPQAATTFYDQALVRATREGRRRQRNRWMMTGFGSAIAAGLVFWMLGGALLQPTHVDTPLPAIPSVVMTIEEPRTINLVFASSEALAAASLTVSLPHGIELAGFPGQREVTWQTSLQPGKNLLPLKLIATSAIGGEVLATLQHDNRDRTFRLRVDVS